LDAKCLIAAKASCTVYRLDNSIVQWGALNWLFFQIHGFLDREWDSRIKPLPKIHEWSAHLKIYCILVYEQCWDTSVPNMRDRGQPACPGV
jgi:hypothetical protein